MGEEKSTGPFRGLLECPLRSGYVEFEFEKGATLNQLLETIEKNWGVNYGWTHRHASAENLGPRGSFGLGEGWVIAAKDRDGAYVLLDRDQLIPIAAPDGGVATDIPVVAGRDHTLRVLGDIEHGVLNVEALFRLLRETRRLKFGFKRDYQLPELGRYDVVLLVLAAVTGG